MEDDPEMFKHLQEDKKTGKRAPSEAKANPEINSLMATLKPEKSDNFEEKGKSQSEEIASKLISESVKFADADNPEHKMSILEVGSVDRHSKSVAFKKDSVKLKGMLKQIMSNEDIEKEEAFKIMKKKFSKKLDLENRSGK